MQVKKITLLTICLCTAILMQAQVNLAFNPTPGETYTYRFGNKMLMTQSLMGQEMQISTTIYMTVDMNIKEKNDNEIVLEYLYRQIALNSSTPMLPMMSINFDSSTGEGTETPFGQLFGGIVGNSVTVTLCRNGSVKSVSGFDAVSESIMSNAAVVDPVTQEMLNSFLQSFNEDAIKQQFKHAFGLFSQEELNIGDSRTFSIPLSMNGMDSETETIYTLVAVRDGVAFFDVTATSAMQPDANNELNMTGEMLGEFTGDMQVDVETGMVISSSLIGDTTGRLSVQGMEVSSEINSQSTITLVR
jgi:hypothetical protein